MPTPDAVDLEVVLDDSALLADRVVRSLHRNNDGHLAINKSLHADSITKLHNVVILYIYTEDELGFTLHEHYVWNPNPRGYKDWCRLALTEFQYLSKHGGKDFYGVYGWVTSTVHITPLRNGDLFIKIDKSGATGVRLAFNSSEVKYEALRPRKKNSHTGSGNRL